MSSRTSAFKLFRRVIPYARGNAGKLGGILFLTLLGSLVTALQPWPLKILVDYALTSSELPITLPWFSGDESGANAAIALIFLAAVASLSLFLLNSALNAVLTHVGSSMGQGMVCACAADLYDKLCSLRLSFHTNRSVGDLLSRLSIDTYAVFTVLQGILVGPVKQLFTLLIVAGFAWSMDPALTGLAFVLAPLMAVMSLFMGTQLKHRSRAQREAQSRLMTHVQRTLSAMPVVQAFGSESRKPGNCSRSTKRSADQELRVSEWSPDDCQHSSRNVRRRPACVGWQTVNRRIAGLHHLSTDDSDLDGRPAWRLWQFEGQ